MITTPIKYFFEREWAWNCVGAVIEPEGGPSGHGFWLEDIFFISEEQARQCLEDAYLVYDEDLGVGCSKPDIAYNDDLGLYQLMDHKGRCMWLSLVCREIVLWDVDEQKTSNHDWHRPMEDNRYCDVRTASIPPMYKWTCSKCGEVVYRNCSAGKPPVDGCTAKGV